MAEYELRLRYNADDDHTAQRLGLALAYSTHARFHTIKRVDPETGVRFGLDLDYGKDGSTT